jgi:hypothetical protein
VETRQFTGWVLANPVISKGFTNRLSGFNIDFIYERYHSPNSMFYLPRQTAQTIIL